VIELLTNFWFLLFGGITVITVVSYLTHTWQKIRRSEAETNLKMAMLERGLTVDEIERLLRPGGMLQNEEETPSSALSDEQIVEKLANRLAGEEISEETIRQVMSAFNASDAQGKRLLYHAIFGLTEGHEPSDAQILALVQGLCGPEGEGVRRSRNGAGDGDLQGILRPGAGGRLG
jgi:hypothetical protein